MNPSAANETTEKTFTAGESRESFMARVREALVHEKTIKPAESAPVADQSITRLASAKDDLAAMFTERATLVGMSVVQLSSSELIRTLIKLLEERSAKKLVMGAGSLPAALAMKDTLRRKGFEIIDWSASPGLGVQFDADVGITDVHGALAETGTLICCSDAGHSRGLSLVPPVHVAIVKRSDILPDIFDYFAKLQKQNSRQLPSSISLITGPSKTADIEGMLIKGVHGPGEVIILLVKDA